MSNNMKIAKEYISFAKDLLKQRRVWAAVAGVTAAIFALRGWIELSVVLSGVTSLLAGWSYTDPQKELFNKAIKLLGKK